MAQEKRFLIYIIIPKFKNNFFQNFWVLEGVFPSCEGKKVRINNEHNREDSESGVKKIYGERSLYY